MKKIMYMAISANGYVAKADDGTPWSEEEWEAWKDVVGGVGNLVIGRKTFDIQNADGDLDDMTSLHKVIVTSTPEKYEEKENFSFVRTPTEALQVLEEKGVAAAFIGGGSKLNTALLEDGLVDELYLDIEPFLFGEGIPLVHAMKKDFDLELIGSKQLNKNTIQLHYKVVHA